MDALTSINLKKPTAAQIEADISLVQEQIALLESEARELSYPAVAGNQQAVTSLAAVKTQIQQAGADLAVLEDAKKIALWQEARAAEAKDGEYRARHMQIARDRAGELMSLADRADALIAEFKTVFTEIGMTERRIWDALRDASAPPSDAVVGRKNLGQFVIASLTAFTNGTDRFGKIRAIADIAKSAWSHLLNSEAATDV